jgi:hypothetical protein
MAEVKPGKRHEEQVWPCHFKFMHVHIPEISGYEPIPVHWRVENRSLVQEHRGGENQSNMANIVRTRRERLTGESFRKRHLHCEAKNQFYAAEARGEEMDDPGRLESWIPWEIVRTGGSVKAKENQDNRISEYEAITIRS